MPLTPFIPVGCELDTALIERGTVAVPSGRKSFTVGENLRPVSPFFLAKLATSAHCTASLFPISKGNEVRSTVVFG